jgi:hypothetical protein
MRSAAAAALALLFTCAWARCCGAQASVECAAIATAGAGLRPTHRAMQPQRKRHGAFESLNSC